jgi:flagellar assembly factor FliW
MTGTPETAAITASLAPTVPPAAVPAAGGVIRSPWIGLVEWDLGCEIFFPAGLPGFEEQTRMVPVEIPAQRPLVYLQSVEAPEVCFVCLPVLVVYPGFHLQLGDEERGMLRVTHEGRLQLGEDVLCLAVLSEVGGTVEADLDAPVVIGLAASRGLQCLSSDPLNGRYRLNPEGRWERTC